MIRFLMDIEWKNSTEILVSLWLNEYHQSFFYDQTERSRPGGAHVKLHKVKKRTAEPQNIEYRMSKDGIASLNLF